METLRFKVKNSELRRKDKNLVASASQGVVYAEIKFEENSEWDNAEKFVIFENDKQERAIVKIGTGIECNFKIPSKALEGYYFIITIFGGEFLTTNALRVGLNYSHINKDSIFDENGYTTDLVLDIYKELNKKYDNIELEDGKFVCYVNGEPLKILDIQTLIVTEIQKYVNGDIEPDDYDEYQFEDNKLYCLKNGEIKKIIPLDIILKNYYTKKEIDEKLSRTVTSVDIENRLHDEEPGVYLIVQTFENE